MNIEPVSEVAIVPSQPIDTGTNESKVWNFLIQNGYSKIQAAGIMGNLQQEHQFRTDGDGLAQWINGRKANLYSRPNPTSLETQLDFLLFELQGSYSYVNNQIKASNDLATVVVIFQNKFEVCNPIYCMENQRIDYAQKLYEKYN